MSSDSQLAARVRGLSKCYEIYAKPADRLKQFLFGRNRKFYREFWALRDVDLDVYKGETLGIVGVNGAGKSTLLQMIAGTLSPTSGTIDMSSRVTAMLELGSGFHQEYTGRENVILAGTIQGMERDEVMERLDSILAFADIGDFIEQPVKTYSKGMFARLAFAVYAHLDPELFIVDEALAVGDARFRHKCMYRFEKMQESGVAILYVSHDAASMKHRCDRVAWIHDGQLQMVGPSNDVVDAYLGAIFHDAKPAKPSTAVDPDAPPSASEVPADERDGSGRCRFKSYRLLDGSTPTTHLDVPGDVSLDVEIENLELDPEHDRIQTGWRLVNSKGLVLMSTNTGNYDTTVPVAAVGKTTPVRWQIQVPRLKPGSYSITLMVSQLDEEGQPKLCDRIVNALEIKLMTQDRVQGLIAPDCEVQIEP